MNIKKLSNDFVNIFFPKTCILCESKLVSNENVICFSCEHQLPLTNFTDFENNAFEKKFTGRIPVEQATSLLFFRKKGNTQRLIHHLKYHERQDVGDFLGEKLALSMLESNRFKNIDAIVIVPLHPKKLKSRGYNQLTTFASQLSTVLNIPILDDVLIKTHLSESQTKKDRFSRFKSVTEKFEAQNLEKIAHKHILLIDDVLTTGATIEACATELLKANNVKISLATMAIPDH